MNPCATFAIVIVLSWDLVLWLWWCYPLEGLEETNINYQAELEDGMGGHEFNVELVKEMQVIKTYHYCIKEAAKELIVKVSASTIEARHRAPMLKKVQESSNHLKAALKPLHPPYQPVQSLHTPD